MSKVERRYFRSDVQPNVIVFRDDGIEVQPYAKLPELDGDCSGVGAALQDRNRKLAAYQEAGFLAIGGNQVRLGQDLQKVAVLQRADQSAQVQVVAKRE